jgi:hypothetical protein
MPAFDANGVWAWELIARRTLPMPTRRLSETRAWLFIAGPFAHQLDATPTSHHPAAHPASTSTLSPPPATVTHDIHTSIGGSTPSGNGILSVKRHARGE